MEKNVLCLPVPETYELSMETLVTAHPNYAPWPKRVPEYVCFIKKGGLVEKVFRLSKLVFCRLEEMEKLKDRVSDGTYHSRIVKYYSTRVNEFGFQETGEWKFYVCEPFADVDKDFYVKHVRASKFMDLNEIPVINK